MRYNETKTRVEGGTGREGCEITLQASRYNIPSFGHGGIDYVYLSLGTPGETGLKS